MDNKRTKVAATALVAAGLAILTPALSHREAKGGNPDLTAYEDVVGVWSYCYGETMRPDGTPVQKGDTATKDQCDSYRDAEEIKRMNTIAKQIKIPLYADVGGWLVAAHTDFAYNIGMNGYAASRTLALTNQGKVVEGCKAMAGWNGLKVRYSNGVVHKVDCNLSVNIKTVNGCRGLVNRRNFEINDCLRGTQ